MGICAWFADVLEYPDERLLDRLGDWSPSGTEADPTAGTLVSGFREDAERMGLARLQEVYTAAFDLDADCSLYVGHHVFGENVRRSLFMARLAAEYRAWPPAAAGRDLPDRLPAVLRYADGPIPGDVRTELVEQVVGPAVRHVTKALADRDHPYASLLRALLVVLGVQGTWDVVPHS